MDSVYLGDLKKNIQSKFISLQEKRLKAVRVAGLAKKQSNVSSMMAL